MNNKDNLDRQIIYLAKTEPELANILREINSILHEIKDELHDLKTDAFVDGDLKLHQTYHKEVIEWQRLRNMIVREALKKAASTGLIAGGVWLAYAILSAIKLSLFR